jgi:hypothetical protein
MSAHCGLQALRLRASCLLSPVRARLVVSNRHTKNAFDVNVAAVIAKIVWPRALPNASSCKQAL